MDISASSPVFGVAVEALVTDESPEFEVWTPEAEFQSGVGGCSARAPEQREDEGSKEGGGGVVNGMAETMVVVEEQNENEKESNREGGLWKASENNPRCPSCVTAIESGMHREDVRCFGGPPCVECKGRGWSEGECAGGRLGGIGEGRKRVRVD